MSITGRCQCGGVAYEIAGAPLDIYVCHCLECRRQSASAFGISAIVRAVDFHVTRGSPTCWSRATDSGNRLDCHFCPDCGCRLFHISAGSATVSVKGGSLDSPPDLATAIHIWTTRKLAGIAIPAGARTFPGEPP